MTERPILCTGGEVRAILDDKKTQTRRVVTVRGKARDAQGKTCGAMLYDLSRAFADDSWPDNDYLHVPYAHPHDGWEPSGKDGRVRIYAPWQSGDLLWVREKWLRVAGETWYFATAHPHAQAWPGWRPSIHMPRWASRITLEVLRVRVERLQAITPADCIAEGCPDELGGEYAVDGMDSRVAWFMYRWDALNAKRAPWSSNPFVWVVEFRRVTE